MTGKGESHSSSARRISHAAITCFSVSAIAFVACGMGLFVNHMLTGILAISGTAAVGLIYLAMGLMTLGYGSESETNVDARSAPSAAADPQRRGDVPTKGGDGVHRNDVASFGEEGPRPQTPPHDTALSSRG